MKVSETSIEFVKQALHEGKTETEVRLALRDFLGVGKTRGNEVFNYIKSLIDSPDSVQEINKRYVYNKDTQKYIFSLKSRSKPVVVPESKIKAIVRSYSKWGEDLTGSEICRQYNMALDVFNGIKAAIELTKDHEPITDEEVIGNSVEDNVATIIQEKRHKIYQKYQTEDWKHTQQDAEKWRRFQTFQVDPYIRFMEDWTPPKYEKIKFEGKINTKAKNKKILINIGDIHVGGKADGRFLYRQKNWNHADLVAAMQDYSEKIYAEIYSRHYSFDEAVVCLSGDIIHTLTGFTDGGTKLEMGLCSEDQIDFAVSIISIFLNKMMEIFPKISVKSVNGNHSYFGDYIVSKMLSLYYRTEERINFEITNQRYLPFKILSSLVILDHGASGKGIKSKLPRAAKARESYIKGILLDRPEILVGVKSKIFLTNDQHHYEYVECSDFDLIIAPSIVGGDIYSDFSGFKSRPSQNVFVFDDDGIRETIRFYFD